MNQVAWKAKHKSLSLTEDFHFCFMALISCVCAHTPACVHAEFRLCHCSIRQDRLTSVWESAIERQWIIVLVCVSVNLTDVNQRPPRLTIEHEGRGGVLAHQRQTEAPFCKDHHTQTPTHIHLHQTDTIKTNNSQHGVIPSPLIFQVQYNLPHGNVSVWHEAPTQTSSTKHNQCGH